MFYDFKLYLLCGRLINLRDDQPLASAPMFGINLNTLYSTFWSLKEVFSATNKAIRLCGLYRPHLAIGV